MAEINTGWITLNVADGTTMRAYMARPEPTGQRTGLLVYQEAFGVNEHIRDVTERFAREGYVAIAPELFHRTAPGFEGAYDKFETVMPHVRALTDQNLEADVRSAYDWLHADIRTQGQRIACVGFCMGGRVETGGHRALEFGLHRLGLGSALLWDLAGRHAEIAGLTDGVPCWPVCPTSRLPHPLPTAPPDPARGRACRLPARPPRPPPPRARCR